MNITWYASVFFLLCYSSLFWGLYSIKKSENALVGSTWFGLSIVLTMCLHTFGAAVICLVKIPVNLYSIGILDLLVSIFLFYCIKKQGERQTYQYHAVDGLAIIIIGVIVIAFLEKQYGFSLSIHYQTIDPAAHFQSAMDIVNNQTVSSMFYSALNNSLWIEFLGPLFTVSTYYKIFILSDVIQLFLSGLLFWCVVRKYCSTLFIKAGALIITVLYLVGYSMNNTIYGFVYLGMGVTIIAFLMCVTDLFLEQSADKKILIPMLMLGCLGIFECYVLFMPVVFFSVFFSIAAMKIRDKKLFSKEMVIECFQIFLIPCFVGLLYTYLGIFNGDTSVGSAISTEGAIYRDLFSNFVPFLPLAIFGFIMNLKKKKIETNMFLLPLLAIFIAGLGYLGLKGKVSSYYFYKNYYLLWLLVLVMVVQSLVYVTGQAKIFLASYFAVFAMVCGMYLTNFEGKVQAKNSLFSLTIKANTYLDVFAYNYSELGSESYLDSKMQLYQYVYQELLSKGQTIVPLAGYWEDDYWYQGITDQRLSGYAYWNYGEEYFFEQLEEEAEYVLVLYDGEIYENNQQYFDSLEKVYENEGGFVAKVNAQ